MCEKQILSISVVLALGLLLAGAAQAADPSLVGWWKFDEGSGTTATDSSGYGNHGTLEGDAIWEPGNFGNAVYIEGSSWVEVPPAAWDPIEKHVTVTFWAFGADAQPINHFVFAAYSADDNAARQASGHIPWSNGNVYWDTGYDGSAYDRLFTALPPEYHKGAWVHWTFTKDGDAGEQKIYINGELFHEGTGYTRPITGVNVFVIGCRGTGGRDQNYAGAIDDFRLYNRALDAEEIAVVMTGAGAGFPLAMGPNPEDGAMLEATWANLSWMPGSFAVSHDLYFGTSFDDVNDGVEGTFVGNLATTTQVVGFPGFPAPEGLQPGTTYYWRIDEVNDANAASPWKGNVWSFWVPPKKAYEASPSDAARFVDTEPTLSWTPGFGSKLHHVYFGDNADEVANATGALMQTETTFAPGALETDKTYYWRVDEFDGATTYTGDVWSFTTVPAIPVHSDPNLVAWWTFDEGQGALALDWSGHGNHATLVGSEWVAPGALGGTSLKIGSYGAIQNLSYAATDLTEVTVTAWVRTASGSDQYIVSFDRNEYYRLEINGSGGGPGQVGWDVMTSTGQIDYGSVTRVDDGRWHHVTGVYDNGLMTIYIDGSPEPSATGGSTYGSGDPRFGFIGANSEATTFDGSRGGGSPIAGEVDDIRIYHRALTAEEIVLVMRGDPRLAWAPSPADGSTPDVDNASPLTWSAGDDASSHEVYFGTDADTVKNADTSDATGVYRGSQSGTSFTPAEGVEWGAGPFYWRVDENNTDGTVTTGRVWSFTVADFILVDDFESYTDNDPDNEAIWQHWIDGFGVPANGSQVGNLLPPYAEQTIVHGGGQSMSLAYDNTAGVRNSEAVLALTAPRDWTKHGVGALSLWFRGYPPSVGSFTEGPVGTFTMTAAGSDIGGTSDQFHFAYKTLTGPGTIVARVDSVQETHVWAKAGVMIRESLDANSKYAFSLVSAASGVAFQGRTDTGAGAVGTTEADIAAPRWVKLERDVAGNFTASHSANGSTWVPVGTAVPLNIPMGSDVYIGLALTSRVAAETCEAKFSNVTITGTTGPQWVHQDVGILGNNAEPLYVSLANATGSAAVVVNGDPAAATIDTWTEWVIDLTAFADQGVNLADVDKIAIGLGATGDAAAPGGTGTVFIDDITLIRPVVENPAGN